MSIPYEDHILIECDRNASKVKQDDNKSLWVTQLNNSVMMLPGDRVEVYNSFINDSGSGSSNPVEFRGADLKKTYTIKRTQKDPADYRTYIPGTTKFYTAYASFNTVEDIIQLTDNEAKTTINYYKCMDGNSYVQLPRRFYPSSTALSVGGSSSLRWAIRDLRLHGRTHRERAATVDNQQPTNPNMSDEKVYGYVVEDLKSMRNYHTDGTFTNVGAIRQWISKNDNSKYTIFRRQRNVYPVNENVPTTTFPILFPFFPPYYARDPEYYDYDIYRETITLSVDKGFSAAKNIAEEITKQLRETELLPTERRLHQILENDAGEKYPQLWYDFNRRVESKTYKTFAACNETTMAEQWYTRALYNGDTVADVLNPTTPGDNPFPGVDLVIGADGKYKVDDDANRESARYYQGYEFIAQKRPEIYDTGTKMNDIFGWQLFSDHFEPNNKTKGLVIDMPYYDEAALAEVPPRLIPSIHLTRMRDFFKAQANYPELFSEENVIKMYEFDVYGGKNPYWDNQVGSNGQVFVTQDNARFLHFNDTVSGGNVGLDVNSNLVSEDVLRYDLAEHPLPEFTQLGNSYYDYRGTTAKGGNVPNFNRALTDNTQSAPFYTHYVPEDKDVFYEIPNDFNESNPTHLSYGFAGAKGQIAADNKIIIYPNKIPNNNAVPGEGCGCPSDFFDGAPAAMRATRKLGFDRHWNAWGTSAIVLCSGIPTTAYASGQDEVTIPKGGSIYQFTPGEQTADLNSPTSFVSAFPLANQKVPVVLNNVESNLYNRYTYCGADFPEFGFDGEYFFFKNLHTPLNVGNLRLEELDDQSQLAAAAVDVYKINPIQQYVNYTPTQFPYEQEIQYHLLGGNTTDAKVNDQKTTRTNSNLDRFTLYDTTTGIFFEDFGFPEDVWDSGLWGRLGFSYEQFNSARNNRSERVTSKNTQDLQLVTTNCAIEAKDSKGWNVDQFNQNIFDGTITHPQNLYVSNVSGDAPSEYFRECQFPRITEPATSLSISAVNYPLALEEGYFTIRSDIVPQSSFVSGSGNTHLPIVGIVNKQSPQGDFYISPSSELRFTVTKPQIITAITVAICDPDGEFAILNDRSSVIFKLTRDRQIDPNVAKEVFEKFAKKSSL